MLFVCCAFFGSIWWPRKLYRQRERNRERLVVGCHTSVSSQSRNKRFHLITFVYLDSSIQQRFEHPFNVLPWQWETMEHSFSVLEFSHNSFEWIRSGPLPSVLIYFANNQGKFVAMSLYNVTQLRAIESSTSASPLLDILLYDQVSVLSYNWVSEQRVPAMGCGGLRTEQGRRSAPIVVCMHTSP